MPVNDDAIALKEKCETALQQVNKNTVTILESAIRALDEVLERDFPDPTEAEPDRRSLQLPTDRATGDRFTPARVIEVVTKQTARTLTLLP